MIEEDSKKIANQRKKREKEKDEDREKIVGVTRDNLHGNFYRYGRRGNIQQTHLRSESG